MKEEISKIYGFNVVDIEKNEESTDGNVYMIKGENEKYVMKVYDSLDQATTAYVPVHVRIEILVL